MNRLQNLIVLAQFIESIEQAVEDIHTLVPKETYDYINNELVKATDEYSPKEIREAIVAKMNDLLKEVKGVNDEKETF